MADFDHGREVVHKSALLNKRFTVANGILNADGMVSLPKLKSHGLVRLTGAVKNQFGCIPGMLKGQFHAKMADPYEFASMLVDINTLIRPRLYVMDAVTAMEGNGPRSGKPRQMNAILLSRDPVALDAVACRMIGLDPEFVPTSRPGEQSGLGTYHSESIEVVGERIETLSATDFQVVREPPEPATGGRLRRLIKNAVTPRPVIDGSKCNACGTCIKMCPLGPRALDWMLQEAGKLPKHNYGQCIRCYCCQEVCPEGAITIKRPALGRVIFRS
jgi:ferredoxin